MEKQTIMMRGKEYDLPLDCNHPDFNGEMPWYNPNWRPSPDEKPYPYLSDFFTRRQDEISAILKDKFGKDPVWELITLDQDPNDCSRIFRFAEGDNEWQVWFMDNAYHLTPYDDFPGYPPPTGAVGRWGVKLLGDPHKVIALRSPWTMLARRSEQPLIEGLKILLDKI
jgi:hypothetical protein